MIDDSVGHTLAHVSTLSKEVKEGLESTANIVSGRLGGAPCASDKRGEAVQGVARGGDGMGGAAWPSTCQGGEVTCEAEGEPSGQVGVAGVQLGTDAVRRGRRRAGGLWLDACRDPRCCCKQLLWGASAWGANAGGASASASTCMRARD